MSSWRTALASIATPATSPDPLTIRERDSPVECLGAGAATFFNADPPVESARHDAAEQLRNRGDAGADDCRFERAAARDIAQMNGAKPVDDDVEHVNRRFVQHQIVGRVEQDLDA